MQTQQIGSWWSRSFVGYIRRITTASTNLDGDTENGRSRKSTLWSLQYSIHRCKSISSSRMSMKHRSRPPLQDMRSPPYHRRSYGDHRRSPSVVARSALKFCELPSFVLRAPFDLDFPQKYSNVVGSLFQQRYQPNDSILQTNRISRPTVLQLS